MTFVKLSNASFPSFAERVDFPEGYSQLTWEQVSEHSFSDEILELLTAIKPDFNRDNVFTLQSTNGFSEAVYTFTLCKSNDGTPVLTFGNGADQNVVPITIGEERVRGANINIFKAGEAVIEFREGQQDSIMVSVAYGNTVMNVKPKFQEGVKLEHLSPVPTIEEFSTMLDSIGSYGYKLKDVVRPLVRKGVKRLDGSICMKVISWQALEKKTGYPQSIEVNVEYNGDVLINNGGKLILKKNHYEPIAMTETGETVKKLTKLYISVDQTPGQQLFDKDFGLKAWQTIESGGQVRLLITSIPTRQPEYYHPKATIQLVSGNKDSKLFQQAQLEPSKTAKASDIMPNDSDSLMETIPVKATTVKATISDPDDNDDIPF